MQKSASQQIKPFININNLNIDGNDTVLICELLKRYQESMDRAVQSSMENSLRNPLSSDHGAVPSSLPVEGDTKVRRIKQIYGAGTSNSPGHALPSLVAGQQPSAEKLPLRTGNRKSNASLRKEAAMASNLSSNRKRERLSNRDKASKSKRQSSRVSVGHRKSSLESTGSLHHGQSPSTSRFKHQAKNTTPAFFFSKEPAMLTDVTITSSRQ